MSNLRNLRFLRNSSPLASRELAKQELESYVPNSEQDGSFIIARYTGNDNEIKSLVGVIYYNSVTSANSITVIDVEGSSSDVESLRQEINTKLGSGITSANTATSQFEALSGGTFMPGTSNSADTSVEGAKAYAYDLVETLDYADTAVTGSYVSAVDETDGVIAVTRVALPDASTVSGESKVVIDVTQSKGAITATASNITGVKLAGYVEGTDADIADTDTLGEALGKLQAQINAMDKPADVVAGQVVTTVTEADGKVTETKANVKDLQLGGYAKTNDTGDIASADTINVALSKLENRIGANAISNDDGSIVVTPQSNDDTDIKVNIKSGEKVIKLDANGGGLYTDIDLVKITTGLPAEIKERYQLLASDDSQLGSNIDIPKDSHIVSINYITTGEHAQNLEYVYIDVSGNTQTTYIDMSELVLEAEFASGVTVTDHVAHGVVDQTSESFLTVGAGGFKLAGVQNAINNAVSGAVENLDADVSGNSTHVTVGVEQVDGKITAVTVSESDIASADAINALSAKTITVATSANGSITTATTTASDGTKSIALETDADKIQMSGFTGTSVLSGISQSDSISDAFEKVEDVIEENELVTAAALTDLDGRVEGLSGKTVTAITSNNNSITTSINDAAGNKTYNIETDASKISGLTPVSDVAGEISGVSATDSVQTGIKNLYDSLATEIAARKAAISAASVHGSSAIDVTETASGDTISLKLDGTKQGNGTEKTGIDNALTITNDGLFLSNTWDCGTFGE